MLGIIGVLSLCVAVLVAAITLLVSLAAVRSGSKGLERAARAGILALAGLFSVASGALLLAMVQSDFRFDYVIRYTEKALPTAYKAVAFWAGQEGSLLLWGWLLSMMGVALVLPLRKDRGPEHTIAVGMMAVVIGFFAVLMFVHEADPFKMVATAPLDGRGLNPMLQNPGMIAHPPILFLGYAGFTIPFALLIGSLVMGRSDNQWVLRARPWVVVSWIFLTAGILLGAEWAYTELGWGGYWAWDPVENASLLPWLTGTAMLHSMVGQRQRGMFKRWTAFLTATTFILCIFGTYITRSGVVDSVHTFGKSLVGTVFGLFLILSMALSAGLLAWRWGRLRSERTIDGFFTREAGILGGNVLLVLMTIATLFGTMLPAITRIVAGESKSATKSFYNNSVLTTGLALLAIMALGPALEYGKGNIKSLIRRLGLPLAAAVIAMAAAGVAGLRSAWALIGAAVAVAVVGVVLVELLRGAWQRRQAGDNVVVSLLRSIDENHRRFGAYVAHVGVAMILVGIIGSSLYSERRDLQLNVGQSAKIAGYTLKYESLREERRENYTAIIGTVAMEHESGVREMMHPVRRLFDKWEDQPNVEVALRSTVREDLYLLLAGWDQNGAIATFQVVVNPLLKWIWIGGWVLGFGALFCLTPQFFGRTATAEAPAVAAAAKPRRAALAAGSRA